MNNKNKFTFIIFLIISIAYNAIGYAFDVDVLKFITFHRNGSEVGFQISFIALFLPVLISYSIYYILKYLKINLNCDD